MGDEACKLELRKIYDEDTLSKTDLDNYVKIVREMKTADPLNFDKQLKDYVAAQVMYRKEAATNKLKGTVQFLKMKPYIESMADENLGWMKKKLGMDNQSIHKIEAVLSGRAVGGRGSNDSIDALGQTLRNELQHGVEGVKLKRELTDEVLSSQEFSLDVLREKHQLNKKLPGFATTNVAAQEMAAAQVASYASMRDMFAAYGKVIGFDENYVGWRKYDTEKVAGNKQLFEELLLSSGVDKKTFLKEPSVELKKARISEMWKHIIEGDAANFDKHRSIFFNDADTEHKFMQAFGYFDNDYQSFVAQTQTMAKIGALMDKFGADYKQNFERLLKWADPQDKNSAVARNMFLDLSGQLSGSVETNSAKISAAARSFEGIKLLWNASLSAFLPDHVASAALAATVDGRSPLMQFHKNFMTYAQEASPAERQLMSEVMSLQSANLAATYSDGAAIGMNGILTKRANEVFRMNGLTQHSDRIRSSLALTVGRIMAEHAGESFEQIPERMIQTLERYNIGKPEWDIIRQAKVDINGIGVLSPRATMSVGADKVAARNAYLKFGTMINDYAKLSTLEGTAYSRQILFWGTKEGTPLGEVARMIGQFKQAGVNTMRLQRRLFNSSSTAEYAGAFAMFTLAGYLSYQARELLVKGHTFEVPDTDTEEGRMRAILMVFESMNRGAGGLMGDTVTAEYNKSYRTFAGDIAGPVISDVGRFAKFASAVPRMEVGSNSTEMINWAKTLIPAAASVAHPAAGLANFMGISPVLEGLVWDNVHNMVNSRYESNVRRKLRDRNQERIKDSF